MKIIMLTFHDVTAIFYSANNRSAERRQDRKKNVSTFCCCFAGYETFPTAAESKRWMQRKNGWNCHLFSPLLTQLWSGEFSSGRRRTRSSSYRCGFVVSSQRKSMRSYTAFETCRLRNRKAFEAFVGCEKCKMMYLGSLPMQIHIISHVWALSTFSCYWWRFKVTFFSSFTIESSPFVRRWPQLNKCMAKWDNESENSHKSLHNVQTSLSFAALRRCMKNLFHFHFFLSNNFMSINRASNLTTRRAH